jgi:type VI secretion system protein VasG
MPPPEQPMLTGEAGVGKTAVVEGFAQRIIKGDVPPQLKDARAELDLAAPGGAR